MKQSKCNYCTNGKIGIPKDGHFFHTKKVETSDGFRNAVTTGKPGKIIDCPYCVPDKY